MDPKFIGKAKLTKQGQLTLPIEARQDLNIEKDAELYWYEYNDSLILTTTLMSTKELVKLIRKKK